MMATKTLLLMVMRLAGRENGGKAKNYRVLSPDSSHGSVYRYPPNLPLLCSKCLKFPRYLVHEHNSKNKEKSNEDYTKTIQMTYYFLSARKKTLKSIIIFITFLNSLSTAKPDQ